jgi:hypothetical protein
MMAILLEDVPIEATYRPPPSAAIGGDEIRPQASSTFSSANPIILST